MADGIVYSFYDYESREEIEGFVVPRLLICPRIGEAVRVIVDDRMDCGSRRVAEIEHRVFVGSSELEARHQVIIYLS